jgi:hypothetical protein
MGKLRNAYKILARKLERKHFMGDLGIDERIILKWALKKQGAH